MAKLPNIRVSATTSPVLAGIPGYNDGHNKIPPKKIMLMGIDKRCISVYILADG